MIKLRTRYVDLQGSMAHDNFFYLFDISMIFYYRPLKNNRFILPLIVAGIFGEMDCFDILS